MAKFHQDWSKLSVVARMRPAELVVEADIALGNEPELPDPVVDDGDSDYDDEADAEDEKICTWPVLSSRGVEAVKRQLRTDVVEGLAVGRRFNFL